MIYAKSNPVESIREHTLGLLKNLELLRSIYPSLLSDRQWEILRTAVLYHDIGKVYKPFQNMIRKQLGLELLPCEVNDDIPHNFLSPLFVPMDELKEKWDWTTDEEKILIQTIAYHHERNTTLMDKIDVIKQAIHQDIVPRLKEIEEELQIPVNQRMGTRLLKKAINQIHAKSDLYFPYVLIKGLLLRLDHAASAHEPIELHPSYSIGDKTYHFLQGQLRPLQRFTYENQQNSLVLIAQTGMGKTEAAFLWLGNDKGFFTLPYRVSINELYKRTTNPAKIDFKDESGQPIAGLLHSTALDYLISNTDSEQKEQESNDWEQAYKQSRLLSRKITFTTIDQVCTFPLHFKGHEKYLATFAYSKLVIDEIQAYSPKITAVLLKALERVHQMGGKFLIMTATMPKFFLEKMKEIGINVPCRTFTNDILRHRIEIWDQCILDAVPFIVQKSQREKVLVICNTVGRSVEMYNALVNAGVVPHLLHSQFTQADRSLLEEKITSFAPNGPARGAEPGVWITTQLVEASIDVDFDVLYTELSELSSLFQRMGRTFRNRPYESSEVNIYLFTNDVSGIGSIYDRDLFELSKQAMCQYHGFALSEECKMHLVEELYSEENLKETKYFREFEKAWEVLSHLDENEYSRTEAQKMMREIQNKQVIPRKKFNEYLYLFDQYEEIKGLESQARKNHDSERVRMFQKKRRDLHREIEKQTINIPRFKAKNIAPMPSKYKSFQHLAILNYAYEFDPLTLTGRGVLYDHYDPSL